MKLGDRHVRFRKADIDAYIVDNLREPVDTFDLGALIPSDKMKAARSRRTASKKSSTAPKGRSSSNGRAGARRAHHAPRVLAVLAGIGTVIVKNIEAQFDDLAPPRSRKPTATCAPTSNGSRSPRPDDLFGAADEAVEGAGEAAGEPDEAEESSGGGAAAEAASEAAGASSQDVGPRRSPGSGRRRTSGRSSPSSS